MKDAPYPTSARASAKGLPCSVVISWARLSVSAVMRSNQRLRMIARSFAVLADQAGSAREAASMARAASFGSRSGTVATSAPVAGSVTENVLLDVIHSPSISAAVGNFLEIMVITKSPSLYQAHTPRAYRLRPRGRMRHDALPFAAAPKRRKSEAETGFDFTAHSGCHCTPRQKAESSGPRTASTRPSSAKASGFSP